MDQEIIDLVDTELLYLPHAFYAQNDLAEQRRKRAIEVMNLNLNNVDHKPYIPYLAMNLFDVFMSYRMQYLGNKDYVIDQFIAGCLIVAGEFTSFQCPMSITNIDNAVEWADFIRNQWYIQWHITNNKTYLPTYIFLQYFSFNLDLEYCLQSSLYQMAYETLLTLVKNEISMTPFGISVIAAAAVLVSVIYMFPHRYEPVRERIIHLCPRLNLDQLKKAVRILAEKKCQEMMRRCNNL